MFLFVCLFEVNKLLKHFIERMGLTVIELYAFLKINFNYCMTRYFTYVLKDSTKFLTSGFLKKIDRVP